MGRNYREFLKGGPQVVLHWVKKLYFVYLLQAEERNFFTPILTTWEEPFRGTLYSDRDGACEPNLNLTKYRRMLLCIGRVHILNVRVLTSSPDSGGGNSGGGRRHGNKFVRTKNIANEFGITAFMLCCRKKYRTIV